MTRIIKARGTTGFGHDTQTVAFSFGDMNERAGVYLDQVRLEATRIIEQARREAEGLKRRAQDEGRQLALAAARKELAPLVDNQVQASLAALRTAAGEVEHVRVVWQRHWEQKAIHLACAIASRVIRRELNEDVTIPLALVREALELASQSGRIKVLLNPDDVESLRPAIVAAFSELGSAGQCEVAGDASVGRGGCRLTTEFGEIDQRIETQLARIEEELAA